MRTFTARLARVLTGSATTAPHADVHLHGGAHGAYVCDNARCESPALDHTDR